MKAAIVTLICGAVLAGCGGLGAQGSGEDDGEGGDRRPPAGPPGRGDVAPARHQPVARAHATSASPRPCSSRAPFRCFVYATDGGPDSWLRMCFKDDKMTGVGTIVGRTNA